MSAYGESASHGIVPGEDFSDLALGFDLVAGEELWDSHSVKAPPGIDDSWKDWRFALPDADWTVVAGLGMVTARR